MPWTWRRPAWLLFEAESARTHARSTRAQRPRMPCQRKCAHGNAPMLSKSLTLARAASRALAGGAFAPVWFAGWRSCACTRLVSKAAQLPAAPRNPDGNATPTGPSPTPRVALRPRLGTEGPRPHGNARCVRQSAARPNTKASGLELSRRLHCQASCSDRSSSRRSRGSSP